MTVSLLVTTDLVVDHYLITASLQVGGTLPQEIFIYENNGTDTLGDFFGTCSLQELGRLQIFVGTAIPTFGNKYVRYGQAKIKVALEDDPESVATTLVNHVTSLNKAYNSLSSVQKTYIIT